ncbi:alcohol dehydrogenase catalytic domain-containing protein [Tessaracoccus oleiagri]|uniref:D-arabinose 1-dehydrogenase, Zn-dependent alcohol dehydrogenase family n=1 Tax=Tessaracoccus oleiagri TaxID=686624 RepID=A0A1G9IFK6_9ACTN|nr:alcohol dehydrogenase catalytic domain-containing protein [Tessaracoccus oleiagri]SDL24021.1 D-arabinose 1-dehydrogenase, Zn-dependent alcohol dehydrogenase family [Tessaracoccus oleiagri]
MVQDIPTTQHAIQFTGKDEILVNKAKPVDPVGSTQMLLQVEACGICFSDTKLLHAFDSHPRKTEVVKGLDADALAGIPSYHPGAEASTPGHEPVARIVRVGDEVRHFKVGDRVLVQADWKHIRTANSNAAFGYNFDGALQEYVLVDERCVIAPDGEQFLIHVSDEPSAAAVGLIEPWATVEGSYAWKERNHVADGGRLLVVGDGDVDALLADHAPADVVRATDPSETEGNFDDIVYFGHDAATIEALLDRLDPKGVLCLVLGGATIDRKVSVDVGRIHYDFIRICGTTGSSPLEGYAWIPATGEVRDGDDIAIVGAAGPMGTMHTIRNVVLEREGLRVTATDLSDERLAHLRTLVDARAAERGVEVRYVNTGDEQLQPGFTYIACMVPVPAFVSELVELAGEGAIFNAFAGIPVGNPHPMDLQHVIERRVFMFGTSGSDVSDMRTVLRKIEDGIIDTHISLDAISGIAGFEDAIGAVMNRTSGGKIMVFPQLRDLPYLRLSELAEHLPHVAEKLNGGVWTREAEDALLRGTR